MKHMANFESGEVITRKENGKEVEKIDARDNLGRNTALGTLAGATGGALIGAKSFDEERKQETVKRNVKEAVDDTNSFKVLGKTVKGNTENPPKKGFGVKFEPLKTLGGKNPFGRTDRAESEKAKGAKETLEQLGMTGEGRKEFPTTDKVPGFDKVSTEKLGRIGTLASIGGLGLGGLSYLGSN